MPQGHTPKGLIVGVKLHQINGEFVFPDYVENTKFNSGSQVLSALKNCKQIFAEDINGDKVIIPYHAVDTYSYGIVPYDGEKPSDTFCKDHPCNCGIRDGE